VAYVIAAYAIGVVGVMGYAAYILKERRALRRALSQGENQIRLTTDGLGKYKHADLQLLEVARLSGA
jgi:hypothetical protein